ncbi:MAG: Flp pilus assembly complex ATPase component TadA [Clostridia bacterium]|nr:Flp pilus assembly complex ATPase component TadA [Clostridia bacterium]
MFLNYAIIFILIAGVIGFFVYLFTKKDPTDQLQAERANKVYTIESMTEFIKLRLDEITRTNLYDIGLSEEELRRRKSKKYELKKALKGCTYGDVNDKKYIKDLIFDLLHREYGVNQVNITSAIDFDNTDKLTTIDKFDILLYMYKQQYGYNALTELITKYNLDDLKTVYGASEPSYVITPEEINEIFEKEYDYLSFEDRLNILSQRIYQNYKGFSVVDEVRDMNIDGISGGVSGLPESFMYQVAQLGDYVKQTQEKTIPRAYDSVWIFYKGKSIQMACLSFGSYDELKRVCQNIYKYNNPGQLSDTNGYKINEMKDGSRVVVVRPSMSESWAFFVRKFDTPNAVLENLIRQDGKEFVIPMLKFLVKGARVTALTGEQGCGKTTMLMAMIKYIYPTLNIRVQETAFELHLRKVYPNRNILTFRETDTVSGQEGLDLQKKTDGAVNILGEVATDEVAAWMIQMAQVASKFTIFTHHAKTFDNLILSLRNSLLKIGMFNNEKVAEIQVVNVMNFEVHLKRGFDGSRFIERITECIPVKEANPYTYDHNNESTIEGKLDKFMDNATHYFTKITETETYKAVNIIEYENGHYVVKNKISDENIALMKENMSEEDQTAFEEFLREYFSGIGGPAVSGGSTRRVIVE